MTNAPKQTVAERERQPEARTWLSPQGQRTYEDWLRLPDDNLVFQHRLRVHGDDVDVDKDGGLRGLGQGQFRWGGYLPEKTAQPISA